MVISCFLLNVLKLEFIHRQQLSVEGCEALGRRLNVDIIQVELLVFEDPAILYLVDQLVHGVLVRYFHVLLLEPDNNKGLGLREGGDHG